MLSIFLVTGTAFAGGSIFGSKSKASNPNGVFSIGVHICGSLNCPNVILKQGDCGEESHTRMQYGVCVCEEGYQVEDDHCVAKDGKKDTPWMPSECATDDDCAEDEQCMGEFCLKIQTEEVSCSSDEMLVDINGDGSVMGCIPCLDNEPLPNALVTDCAETCPNREVIEVDGMEACALKECPAGYAMDFGLTEDGRTLLVEINDGFALGSYGLDPIQYAKLLSACWAEAKENNQT
jgi:hypothetical protein